MRHNARIARSGVQYYTYDELPNLGLTSVPREYANLRVFGVYRSAQCLKDAMPLFKHVPVMVGHQHWAVGGVDDPLSVGRNEEVPTMKMCKGEVSISAPLDIDDDSVLTNVKEISPGYNGTYHWQGGVATSGEEFQIVCDKIVSVNHIALVPEARGGKDMAVLDGGKGIRKICSGLIRFAKRKRQGVADSATSAFASTLEDIKKNRQRWTDEEMAEHTNTLVALTEDLPDSEEKQKLLRFIADIPLLKEEEDGTVEEALNTLQEFYSSLDKDAISDVMENGSMEKPTDQKPEEEKKTEDALPPLTEPNPPAPDNPVNPATPPEPTQDAPTADPVLTAITSLNEKLDKVIEAVMATKTATPPADGCNGDEAPKETEVKDEKPEPEEKTEPENKVGDQMPLYTQTMQTMNKGADLDALFASMKERR